MSDHHVTFFARHDGLHALCSCGWSHRWLPWAHVADYSYGSIIAIGLEHARQGDPLPKASDAVTA